MREYTFDASNDVSEAATELNGVHSQLCNIVQQLIDVEHDHLDVFAESNAIGVAVRSLEKAVDDVKACMDELTH